MAGARSSPRKKKKDLQKDKDKPKLAVKLKKRNLKKAPKEEVGRFKRLKVEELIENLDGEDVGRTLHTIESALGMQQDLVQAGCEELTKVPIPICFQPLAQRVLCSVLRIHPKISEKCLEALVHLARCGVDCIEHLTIMAAIHILDLQYRNRRVVSLVLNFFSYCVCANGKDYTKRKPPELRLTTRSHQLAICQNGTLDIFVRLIKQYVVNIPLPELLKSVKAKKEKEQKSKKGKEKEKKLSKKKEKKLKLILSPRSLLLQRQIDLMNEARELEELPPTKLSVRYQKELDTKEMTEKILHALVLCIQDSDSMVRAFTYNLNFSTTMPTKRIPNRRQQDVDDDKPIRALKQKEEKKKKKTPRLGNSKKRKGGAHSGDEHVKQPKQEYLYLNIAEMFALILQSDALKMSTSATACAFRVIRDCIPHAQTISWKMVGTHLIDLLIIHYDHYDCVATGIEALAKINDGPDVPQYLGELLYEVLEMYDPAHQVTTPRQKKRAKICGDLLSPLIGNYDITIDLDSTRASSNGSLPEILPEENRQPTKTFGLPAISGTQNYGTKEQSRFGALGNKLLEAQKMMLPKLGGRPESGTDTPPKRKDDSLIPAKPDDIYQPKFFSLPEVSSSLGYSYDKPPEINYSFKPNKLPSLGMNSTGTSSLGTPEERRGSKNNIFNMAAKTFLKSGKLEKQSSKSIISNKTQQLTRSGNQSSQSSKYSHTSKIHTLKTGTVIVRQSIDQSSQSSKRSNFSKNCPSDSVGQELPKSDEMGSSFQRSFSSRRHSMQATQETFRGSEDEGSPSSKHVPSSRRHTIGMTCTHAENEDPGSPSSLSNHSMEAMTETFPKSEDQSSASSKHSNSENIEITTSPHPETAPGSPLSKQNHSSRRKTAGGISQSEDPGSPLSKHSSRRHTIGRTNTRAENEDSGSPSSLGNLSMEAITETFPTVPLETASETFPKSEDQSSTSSKHSNSENIEITTSPHPETAPDSPLSKQNHSSRRKTVAEVIQSEDPGSPLSKQNHSSRRKTTVGTIQSEDLGNPFSKHSSRRHTIGLTNAHSENENQKGQPSNRSSARTVGQESINTSPKIKGCTTPYSSCTQETDGDKPIPAVTPLSPLPTPEAAPSCDDGWTLL